MVFRVAAAAGSLTGGGGRHCAEPGREPAGLPRLRRAGGEMSKNRQIDSKISSIPEEAAKRPAGPPGYLAKAR